MSNSRGLGLLYNLTVKEPRACVQIHFPSKQQDEFFSYLIVLILSSDRPYSEAIVITGTYLS